MQDSKQRIEYIMQAKALLREDLRAKSWPEKVRSIERMNAAKKIAQEAMNKALQGSAAISH